MYQLAQLFSINYTYISIKLDVSVTLKEQTGKRKKCE